MKKLFLALGLFLILSPAYAEPVMLGTVSGTEWSIYANPEEKSCFVAASYQSGTSIILVNSQGAYTIILGNRNWKLGEKSVISAVAVFDQRERWDALFSAYGDTISVNGVDPKFVSAFSRSQILELYTTNGALIGKFILSGTTKAINALGICANVVANPQLDNRNSSNPNAPKPFGE